MKIKRKELQEINDDFSDFSLSSPARKIRRLDAELPPIMEEEEAEKEIMFHSNPEFDFENQRAGEFGGAVIEELELPNNSNNNEERAIVLFKPLFDNPLLLSPSDCRVSLSSDLISGFKNRNLWSRDSNPARLDDDEKEAARGNQMSVTTDNHLAVVPWVPSHSQFPPNSDAPMAVPQIEAPELMDAEEMEASSMDVEESNMAVEQGQVNELGGRMRGSEGFQQWQQQHCMTPQIPQNTSTPITWSW
ncbi:hypothetical protein RJ641_025775 [Dillenia turbinata]|uniref:Uncharacterized protein n=1 Tax=Dillenia turbinata TaxID=194707 RepID=A0AAN8ZS03_9MAGN